MADNLLGDPHTCYLCGRSLKGRPRYALGMAIDETTRDVAHFCSLLHVNEYKATLARLGRGLLASEGGGGHAAR